MVALLAFAGFLIAVNTETYQEYARNSNGNPDYALVTRVECPTGLRDSGYALTPSGGLVLKQKNWDGSVSEPVCK